MIDYNKYKQDNLKTTDLDDMMKFITSSGTGKIGAIIAGLKIFVCAAYMYARSRLVKNELLIDKQNMEQELNSQHHDDNNVVG
jgi:hypothetical protein